MAVIRPEISTDPAELEQIAIRYLQDGFPEWQPADGDLMTWLIGAHARMIAEERDIAADVPIEQILRPLGEEVHQILPRVATGATVNAVVTLIDDSGYTVPEGTEVLVRTAGDDGVTMAVTDDVTVRPGEGVAGEFVRTTVRLRAISGREGIAGNGLRAGRNSAVLIRPLEFVTEVALLDESTGGTDAETDEQYLQRLVDTLALTSPVPILPEDFAALARQQPGVSRALAFNDTVLREEILRITTQASTRAEIEDLTNGVRASITSGLTAAQLTTALSALNPVVEGGPAGTAPFTVRLRNYRRFGPWQFTIYGSSVTDARTLGSLVVEQRAGVEAVKERAITVAVVGPDGAEVSANTLRGVKDAIEAVRELNWDVSVIGPSSNVINVDFAAVTWPTYAASTVQQTAEAALEAYLSPARWGMGDALGDADSSVWVEERVVRYLEIAQVLNEVPGLRYVTSLTVTGPTAADASGNITMTGLAPMPKAGEINGRVTEG
ncbi:baseplate J/gp47 family protein [Conexibacter sp. JD483]|uniref:baseplate J/gp47 family protein n=1 Tax=unclassified Conexibacter TaxID=2627773 RepID=UPI002727CDB4|nr:MULTISPECIES: baseplate J/gp47 family protein [unclassified Conexibacter]MDO8187217.1 baseplate J/gp47 family protein [Conexibacter sp. CPCC 205706]MDO8199314.1 baseplate J/gp47 family protein [Conexibacter sp. CPCC 205762]MDR9369285.1 baseplate J/gp47 family protein [Conexibacter sp. JD483]